MESHKIHQSESRKNCAWESGFKATAMGRNDDQRLFIEVVLFAFELMRNDFFFAAKLNVASVGSAAFN